MEKEDRDFYAKHILVDPQYFDTLEHPTEETEEQAALDVDRRKSYRSLILKCPTLTLKERQVAEETLAGRSKASIAERMGVSESTIKRIYNRVIEKVKAQQL